MDRFLTKNEFESEMGYQNALGIRFQDKFNRASLGTSYTKTGTVASFSPDGSKLVVSSGNGTFLEYITRNDYVSNADDYTVSLTFKVNVVNSTSYGLGIRLDSYSNGTQKQSTGYYVQTDNGSSNGVIRNLGNVQVNDGSVMISANDVIRLTIRCYKNVQYITSENLTKKTTNYATYKNTLLKGATNTLLPNSVKAAIFTTGGTFEVTDFTFFVNTVQRPDFGFIGDSLISGYYGGAIDGRMVNLIAQVDKSKKVIVYGRQGCVTADIADNLTEILAFKSKVWFLNIGYNDVAQGRSDTITQLGAIVSALEAAGSTVIFLSILQNKTLSDSIRIAFPLNRFIDISTPITNAAGTAYLSKYNADTIHPNALAQITMANTLLNSAQDLFPSINPVLFNDLKFGVSGDSYQNDITIGTLDNFALDFIVNSIKAMRLSAGGSLKVGNANNPAASALLDLESNTKGFLLPRMTETQRNNISSPSVGLFIFNTTTNKMNFYNGSAWETITSS